MLSSTELDLAKRKEIALKIAVNCTQLLQEKFGAKRVILFGSLAGQTPWHNRSDIDLAVEGLPEGNFFQAYAACRQLLTQELQLDLLALEDVYPEMRSRILQGIDMTDNSIILYRN